MAKCDMPIGKPIYFEGDILKYEPDAMGFFYCKITSPLDLKHPILQRKIKTKDGLRTIAGLGSWEGFIFSEEMKNAIKYGYQFEIISGYQFNRGNLFEGYVEKMYTLRSQYDKTHPLNLIAKLLLNSLYGRFGMRTTQTRVDIYNCDTNEEIKNLTEFVASCGETIEDFIQVDKKYVIVRDTLANLKYNDEDNYYHGFEVNVGIASAVTSFARVYMSKFKNNPHFNLYYSDTDSIVIDQELPANIVGSKLGQLKLEYVLDEAVFLAPKVYGFISDKGEKVIKVKGISNDIANNLTMRDLETLLIADSSREFTQEKWFKKIFKGEIRISDVIYTLKVNSNKRFNIYKDNIFNDTRPYFYDEIMK